MNKFTLAPIFQDHMVLQRNRPIRIFGTGQDGQNIVVNIADQQKKCVVKGGVWIVEFEPMSSLSRVSINIVCGNTKINIKEAVFGEVYIAGGQSNMQFMLKETFEYEEAKKSLRDIDFRFYFTPRIAYEGEDKSLEPSGWYKSEEDQFELFSAVAYFFGLKISEYMDCSVGIIGCNWGGTSLFNWISEEEGEAIVETSNYFHNLLREGAQKNLTDYENEVEKYNQQLRNFDQKIQELKKSDKDLDAQNPLDYYHRTKMIEYPWPPPQGPKSFLRPGGLYEFMLKTIAPFMVQGVLWYQGESDVLMGTGYGIALKALFASWRKLFCDEKLFFLVVQLPMYSSEEKEDEARVKLRQAQYQTSKEDPYAAIACIQDLGEKDNIHPFLKKDVGLRLGLLAGKYIYKTEDVAEGPIFKEVIKEKNGYRLCFSNASKGMYADRGCVLGFQIVEESQVYPVKAEIVGHDLWIPINEVKQPKHVKSIQYGYKSFIWATLFNWKRLPMYPFSIDIQEPSGERRSYDKY